MRVASHRGRFPGLLIVFQDAWFVAIAAVPAYVAGMRALERGGVAPTWFHRAGLVVASLLVSLLAGLLMVAVFAAMGRVVSLISATMKACLRLVRR